jgi:hypothetical protein
LTTQAKAAWWFSFAAAPTPSCFPKPIAIDFQTSRRHLIGSLAQKFGQNLSIVDRVDRIPV